LGLIFLFQDAPSVLGDELGVSRIEESGVINPSRSFFDVPKRTEIETMS